MRSFSSMAVAAILALTGFSAHAADDCRLHLAASLPMMIDSTGRITIPMSISDHTVRMLVDTGGFASFLTADAAQKAGLVIRRNYDTRFRITFYGGATVRDFAKAQNVALAQMKADSMPFGIMPEPMPIDEDGILGQDILRAYDLDFDFAGGKLNFYSPDHCEGRVVYWTDSPVAVIPFRRDNGNHIVVDTQLDGRDLTAMFDTGASRSEADWGTVSSKLGLVETSPGVKKLSSDGPRARYSYPFKVLIFGGITVNNPDIGLATSSVSQMPAEQPALLVGINVMRQFHLYIANGENKLYVTAASAH